MPAAWVPAPMVACTDTAMLPTGVRCKTGLSPRTDVVQRVQLAPQAAEETAAVVPAPRADYAGNTGLLN